MKIKQLKYKGIPISPIVLFKTILNDENKTLDKVLFNLEIKLNILSNKLNILSNKLNTCINDLNNLNDKYNTLNNTIFPKAYEYIKRTDTVYIDDILTYDDNPNKSYNFKEITKVSFDKDYPYIELDNGNYLSISPIENMSDYEFEPSDPFNRKYYSYIKQKSTGTYIIAIKDSGPNHNYCIERLRSTDDIIHKFKLHDSQTSRSIEIIF